MMHHGTAVTIVFITIDDDCFCHNTFLK
jgi:hypothetical protein